MSSGSGFLVDLQFSVASAGPRQEETDQIWDMDFSLKRNTLIIVYCLVITFTFWLITIIICLIMITTVVFGFRQRNEIVVVPIGTVFAFTQLRSSMPGAPPGFGHTIGPSLGTNYGTHRFNTLSAFGALLKTSHAVLDFAY
ncbi:hypothetical protein IW261DRAFT_1565567 [Armillaria novae-zelandiae]|uniref:Uncharacterized protein n=1 Tax=Armillaria novae-zelandiae TaxID=153914 RepID=A0AA39P5D6_9AGAR|nr:hypothetical protein IW261DRAFT_1565567 [Armillaria novae-zelandiae]